MDLHHGRHYRKLHQGTDRCTLSLVDRCTIVVVVGMCQVEEYTMFDRCTIKVVEMHIRCGVDHGGKGDASWWW